MHTQGALVSVSVLGGDGEYEKELQLGSIIL